MQRVTGTPLAIDVKPYLMGDSHFTLVGMRPVLPLSHCRHAAHGHLEVLFGKEVVEKMPRIMAGLVEAVRGKAELD